MASRKIHKKFDKFRPDLGESPDITDQEIDHKEKGAGQDGCKCQELRGNQPAGREVFFHGPACLPDHTNDSACMSLFL